MMQQMRSTIDPQLPMCLLSKLSSSGAWRSAPKALPLSSTGRWLSPLLGFFCSLSHCSHRCPSCTRVRVEVFRWFQVSRYLWGWSILGWWISFGGLNPSCLREVRIFPCMCGGGGYVKRERERGVLKNLEGVWYVITQWSWASMTRDDKIRHRAAWRWDHLEFRGYLPQNDFF